MHKTTTVALDIETVQRLKDIGKKGETYDDIVNALLDARYRGDAG
jgi:hypothetical protein